MINESLAIFIKSMGEPTTVLPIPSQVIENYQNRVPDFMLEVWQAFGLSVFKDGLFNFTNPLDFEFILDLWLEETPLKNKDNYFVFGKTAFGDIFFIGEKSRKVFSISCCIGLIHADTYEGAHDEVRKFITLKKPSYFDIEDLDDDSLFDQALEKLGPLQSNEIYGFVPALCMGGEETIDNLQKVEMIPHLAILREMGGPPRISSISSELIDKIIKDSDV